MVLSQFSLRLSQLSSPLVEPLIWACFSSAYALLTVGNQTKRIRPRCLLSLTLALQLPCFMREYSWISYSTDSRVPYLTALSHLLRHLPKEVLTTELPPVSNPFCGGSHSAAMLQLLSYIVSLVSVTNKNKGMYGSVQKYIIGIRVVY